MPENEYLQVKQTDHKRFLPCVFYEERITMDLTSADESKSDNLVKDIYPD